MIELTRLNGHRLFVNCDLLKFAEASPDTVLTLMTGEKIVVMESCEDVMKLALQVSRECSGCGVAGQRWSAGAGDAAVERMMKEQGLGIGIRD